jgi:aldose 1-epimerase
LYTPPLKNSIAIEPTTGVSNSFNNAIGVKVLHPNESYNINWNLKIEDN